VFHLVVILFNKANIWSVSGSYILLLSLQPYFRLHLIAFLLLALLVLDETLGAYQKSRSEGKKQKKNEGEAREAKNSESAVKQHKR
jgi:hypothetical protein